MTAIVEIPEVRQRVSPLSVEEYHRLDAARNRGVTAAGDGRYRHRETLGIDATLTPSALPGISIRVADLFR